MNKIDEYKALLEGILDEYRYIHTLNVADSARELAKLYGEDEDKAYLAGLLHDIMKNTDKNKQLQIIQKDDIILSESEKNNPKLWHAMAGASYVKLELKISDEQIINAVRYHTTGRAKMSKFEKIIYIADFISAERNYPDVDVMRKLSQISLEKAALYALKFSISKLAKDGLVIHTDSVEFYNELICERININD
ncbi:MAG: bis(5'-nucleosyl)-tetraphosphatase (symmetrical) YqeK [Clostridia bacterium]